MVTIFHIVKKANCDTQFRTAILKALTCARQNNRKIKVYIASGFFDEIVNSKRTPVSSFTDLNLNTNLRTLLSDLEVEVLGAYNGKKDLVEFCKSLRLAGASVKVFYKHRFHTKLFIIESNGEVLFEIIGSSNLTISAYEGIRHTKTKIFRSYNSECDLILIKNSLNFKLETNENVMQLKYDEIGNKISIKERMNSVLKQIEEFKVNNNMQDITHEIK